jgi:glycosyltransferase involved in cell wall biosynthesis
VSDVYQKVRPLFERYQKVVVHYGGGHHLLAPLIQLKKEFGSRLLIIAITQSYQHDNWKRIPVSTYQFFLYKKYVDYVVFQCPYAAHQMVGGNWLLAHNRGGFIPLGLEDFSDARMSERPVDVVGTPDIRGLLEEEDKFNFIFLGEFRPGKGQFWLFHALLPVLKKNPHVRMFFLGGAGVWPLLDAMREKVKACGVEKQVICPGNILRKYVPWILAHCHAALIPTRAETFGHCFAEPAMAGIPIIGTRVGVGEYLIQDMLTGIGYTFGNTEGVREAAQFLATHKEAARKMGQTLRTVVKEEFLHVNVARAYMSLYEKLLGRDAL